MIQTIQKFMNKPELYASSTARFWDDEHISKGMLKAHLAPELDSATRNHTFVRQSAENAGKLITYRVCDYLTLDYSCQFDTATLIYCDFGALSDADRTKLLERISIALCPGGLLIFDVFTPFQYSQKPEFRSWECVTNGFWNAGPHLCLSSLYRYEEQNTFLSQYIVVTEDDINCYHIWEHTFTKEELQDDLSRAGFRISNIYGDIAGNPVQTDGKQMCIVAEKL